MHNMPPKSSTHDMLDAHPDTERMQHEPTPGAKANTHSPHADKSEPHKIKIRTGYK